MKKRCFALFALVLALLTQMSPMVLANSPAKEAAEVVIRDATILTASHGTLPESDILIKNGKIAAVGKNLKVGANAKVIEAKGKFVTPGIIDCHSHAMVDAVNEFSVSVTSMCRIQDVLNPTDQTIYRALAGGVTAMNLLHGSANAIGGQNAVVKNKYGHPGADFIIPDAPPGIKFALGENPKRSNAGFLSGTPRYPATRMGVEEIIREAFTQARDYQRTWDEYRAAVAKGDKTVQEPRRDLQLEPLVEVLEGKRFVHSHCYRADEILMLIGIAEDFGFKIRTFQHTLEGYKVAREIAKHGAMASVFVDMWSYKIEAYDAIPYLPVLLTRSGVVTSINSDSGERIRRLNIDAAKAMKYGDLTEEEALRMVTLNPAIQLGIDKRTGSIDVGKDADIAIWNAHPFSVYAHCDTTLVEGEVLFDRELDLKNREAMAKERAELERDDSNKPKPGGAPPAAPRRPPSAHGDNCMEGAQ